MKWESETYKQKMSRLRKVGVRKFAYFPTIMDDGTVVFWEHYWAAQQLFWNRCQWRRALTRERAVELANPPRPAPPRTTDSSVNEVKV